MSDATRRGFLVMTGAGAAAVAVPGAVAQPVVRSYSASGSLVAHIADVAGSALSIMVGEREVVVRDPDLVARLVHAARLSDRA